LKHYDIGKYGYPGTGYCVLRNGHICYSGTKGECLKFVERNNTR
jgi:hypothetical protein